MQQSTHKIKEKHIVLRHSVVQFMIMYTNGAMLAVSRALSLLYFSFQTEMLREILEPRKRRKFFVLNILKIKKQVGNLFVLKYSWA